MGRDQIKTELADYLFLARSGAEEGTHLFCLMDAVSNPHIVPHLVTALPVPSDCLFSGSAKQDLGDQTAWLADVTDDATALETLVDEGYAKGMLSFLLSPLELKPLIRHLKRFTKVRDPEGTEHFFRFYDPKVMRQYLPVFTASQRDMFFSQIICAIFEDTRDSTKLFRFAATDGALKSEIIDLEKRFKARTSDQERVLA
jgi:hypothetical protein